MYLNARLPTYLLGREEKRKRRRRKEGEKLGTPEFVYIKKEKKNKEILYLRYVWTDRQINVEYLE